MKYLRLVMFAFAATALSAAPIRLENDSAVAEISPETGRITAWRLKKGENLDTVFVEKGQTGGSMSKIIALAKEAGCPVKEVTSQVSEASADCGIIYATDAFSAGLTVVDSATAEMCGQVIYPAAVLKGDKENAAQDFLAYLQTDAAMTVFESVGFSAA